MSDVAATTAGAPAPVTAPAPQPTGAKRERRVSVGLGKARGLAQVHRTGYSFEGLDGDRATWSSTQWHKPDVLKARQYYRSLLFEDGEAPLWSTQIKNLSALGVGISLHFRFLKYLFWFFSIATIVSLPALVINFSGGRLTSEQVDVLHVATLSIANSGAFSPYSNVTTSPWGSLGPDTSYTGRQVSAIIMAVDFACVWFFLLFILFLYGRIRAVTSEVDSNVITAADYAVYVRGLPPDATEDEVRQHFDRLYNLREKDWTFPSSLRRCCFAGRKTTVRRQFHIAGDEDDKPRRNIELWRELRNEEVYPVLDARNTGNKAYLRSWVAEVTIATANGSLIRRYQALSGMFQRIRTARAMVKKRSPGSPEANHEKLRIANARLDELDKQMEVINKKYARDWCPDCVGAFVVFNCEESVRRCLTDYAGSDSALSLSGYLWQAEPLRFRGKHRLTVTRAPDPSQIVWENLEIPFYQRLYRQTLVNLLLLSLLAISFIFIILAQAQQAKFQAQVPQLSTCGVVLPAVAFDVPITSSNTIALGSALPPGLTLLRDDTIPICIDYDRLRIYWSSSDNSQLDSSPHAPTTDVCHNDCISPSNPQSCSWPTTDGRNITFLTSATIACYCKQQLVSEISSKGVFTGATSVYANEGTLCQQVASDYVTYNAFAVVASLIVVTINQLLRLILMYITNWEGHTSIGSLHKAIVFKVFLSLFLNTACIVLLINAALPTALSQFTINGQQVFAGNHAGFDVSWHCTVGASLVLTMLINVVSPQWYNVGYLLCFLPCRRLTGDKHAVTQAQLNERYTPPEFEMPTRVAVLLSTLFSTFMYSSGEPLMLPIAAASFGFMYFVDKAALLRMTRRPPMHDNSLALFAQQLMPYAAIIHLLIAIWTYSEDTVLYSPNLFGVGNAEVSSLTGTSTASKLASAFYSLQSRDHSGLDIVNRLARENSFPLFALLVVFVIAWMLYIIAGIAIVRCFRGFFGWVSGGYCCVGVPARELQFNPPFCGNYALPLDASKKHRLTRFEMNNGWVIVRDSRGLMLKIRKWLYTGATFGIPHTAGQRMLTWQVLASQGIASYDPLAHPLYAPAIRAMEAARVRQEMKRFGKSFRRVGGATAMAAAAADALAGSGAANAGPSSHSQGARVLVRGARRAEAARDVSSGADKGSQALRAGRARSLPQSRGGGGGAAGSDGAGFDGSAAGTQPGGEGEEADGGVHHLPSIHVVDEAEEDGRDAGAGVGAAAAASPSSPALPRDDYEFDEQALYGGGFPGAEGGVGIGFNPLMYRYGGGAPPPSFFMGAMAGGGPAGYVGLGGVGEAHAAAVAAAGALGPGYEGLDAGFPPPRVHILPPPPRSPPLRPQCRERSDGEALSDLQLQPENDGGAYEVYEEVVQEPDEDPAPPQSLAAAAAAAMTAAYAAVQAAATAAPRVSARQGRPDTASHTLQGAGSPMSAAVSARGGAPPAANTVFSLPGSAMLPHDDGLSGAAEGSVNGEAQPTIRSLLPPSPHLRRQPEHVGRPQHQQQEGRSIIAPYGGGGADAAAFTPVVLIRPSTADPVQAQQLVQQQQQHRRGSEAGGAGVSGPTFMPVTLVRPPGDSPAAAAAHATPAASTSGRRRSDARYAAQGGPPQPLGITPPSSGGRHRGGSSTTPASAHPEPEAPVFAPLTVVRPVEPQLRSPELHSARGGKGRGADPSGSSAPPPSFVPVTVVRPSEPPRGQHAAPPHIPTPLPTPLDLHDDGGGDYAIDAFVLASLSHRGGHPQQPQQSSPPPEDVNIVLGRGRSAPRPSTNASASGSRTTPAPPASLVSPVAQAVHHPGGRTVVRHSRAASGIAEVELSVGGGGDSSRSGGSNAAAVGAGAFADT